MTRSKKLIILVVILAVLCAAFAAVKISNDKAAAEEAAATNISIFTSTEDTISDISWTYDNETVELKNEDGTWSYAKDASFPLNTTYVTSMVNALSDVTATKEIDEPSDGDLTAYGLDEPSITLTVTADGATTTLSFGGESSISAEIYASTGNGKIYLVDSSILDNFKYGLMDLVKCETVPSIYYISDVTVKSDQGTTVIEKKEGNNLAYDDSYVWFMKDGNNYLTLDTDLTEDYLDNVKGLVFSTCVNYNATDEELEEYGLLDPEVDVTFNYTSETVVDTDEKDEDGNVIQETVEEPATYVFHLSPGYVRVNDSRMVYAVDTNICSTMEYTTYSDLRPDEVLLMDWDTVDSVDMTLDGKTYTFERNTREAKVETESSSSDSSSASDDSESETTTETYWTYNGKEVAAGDVFNSITSLESTGDALGISPTRSEEISFTIHRQRDTFADVTITFYQYDSESCLTVLNDDTTVFVARSSISDLKDAAKALVTN